MATVEVFIPQNVSDSTNQGLLSTPRKPVVKQLPVHHSTKRILTQPGKKISIKKKQNCSYIIKIILKSIIFSGLWRKKYSRQYGIDINLQITWNRLVASEQIFDKIPN